MVSASDYNLLQSIVDIVGFLIITIGLVVQSIVLACLPKSYRKYKELSGQNILVTGGGGGLGRLLALRLTSQGAKVIVWDVNQEGIDETIKQVKAQGGVINGLKCDLSKNEDVYRVAQLTKEKFGDIDILINNAGVLSGKYLLDTPDHLIKLTFDVNIIAHFWTVKAFLPSMIARNKGHIITIASMAGHVGVSKLVDYCSSKYAAVGFDEALRMELEDQNVSGVKTTAICPYFIQSTGMFGSVQSRFLSTLKLSDVADRIVEAIRQEEKLVMIPALLKLTILLKLLMPWSVVSIFMRGLVPDAVPDESSNKLNNNMVKVTSKEAVNLKNE